MLRMRNKHDNVTRMEFTDGLNYYVYIYADCKSHNVDIFYESVCS